MNFLPEEFLLPPIGRERRGSAGTRPVFSHSPGPKSFALFLSVDFVWGQFYWKNRQRKKAD
ncbi:MAG: hypothetical protein C6P37_13220 [Caldibacillus debilis]|uniref:Uncharacterized protein n=1 Tax=Caldibacillus debilis TaxID=301148 RepID=A0A3E0K1L0_9BACI|nr:MAG: hypothetical protein C6P37_13220 [Caldibacillus debilis]